MKKFMFTAIAMVAFMGISMANTIDAPISKELKTEKKLEVKKKAKLFKKSQHECMMIGFAASDAVYAAGGSPEIATAAANAAYTQCMK